jgi:hypothetical protein
LSSREINEQVEKMNKPLCALGLTLCLVAAACAPKPIAEKKPAPDYQMKAAAITPPANVKNICYDESSMSIYYTRMTQQQLAVGTLSCQEAGGKRRFEKQYGDVLAKYSGDLSSNASDIKAIAAKRRLNMDVLVTEFANREAQQRQNDPQYCERFERAFAWALSPAATSLSQVPPPHDYAAEMNAFPCPK